MRRAYVKRLYIWGGHARLWLLRLEGRIAKSLRLRRWYIRHVMLLVQRTGLFDQAWYLEINPDVTQSQIDALQHYVRSGDKEGRHPMPLFDPAFYRAHAEGRKTRPNSLLHYFYLGRHLRISPSPWFDVDFYQRQNRDVSRSGGDPLLHYLEHGGLEGRSPCRQFDAHYYLQNNPDVWASRVNPLIHYLKIGRLEGRFVSTADATGQGAPDQSEFVAPAVPEHWDDVAPRGMVAQAKIDVIIPVYKGCYETLRCIRSVLLSCNETTYSLVVINDCSPDEELSQTLERHASNGLFTLLHNDVNEGFVITANRGFALHADRDVILLNADTEVYGDWLDRLKAAAYRDAMTGTVTPLSNNATIASYPRFPHENPYPLEISFAELDALTAKTNSGVDAEAPTGIGFCMYVRRDCLDDVGFFDSETFGRGYGEENDFCQRAIRNGWRNIIAADTFVHHLGAVSFQGQRAKAVDRAMRVLKRLYPNYHADVREFISNDPLQEARARLDWERLRAKALNSNALLVCHNRGGGAERHVREDTERLRAAGSGVFYLRPVPGQQHRVWLGHPDNLQLPNLQSFEFGDTETLVNALRQLRISSIHDHGMVDFAADSPEFLLRVATGLGASLEVDIHDYKVICPRVNLATENGRYCGEPDEKQCDACLGGQGNKFGVRSIRAWRASHQAMLQAADTVWVPDEDVQERLRGYFGEIRLKVAPHEEIDLKSVCVKQPVLGKDEPIHIVILGAISKIKGYEVLLNCAREAQQKRMPLRFSLLGYSLNDAPLRKAGVKVSGRYLEQEGADRLRAIAPHVVWLPSLWPETYSYTLSLALAESYPVVAFDIGAIARRLREAGLESNLLPMNMLDEPERINGHFLSLRNGWMAAT